jgi:hypothetical protein
MKKGLYIKTLDKTLKDFKALYEILESRFEVRSECSDYMNFEITDKVSGNKLELSYVFPGKVTLIEVGNDVAFMRLSETTKIIRYISKKLE